VSFFGRVFRRRGKVNPLSPSSDQLTGGADRALPPQGKEDALSELRHRARTGDPTLTGRHHSGSFSGPEKK